MAISTLPFSRAIQYPHLSSQSKSPARGNSSVPGEPVYESGNFVIAPFVGHGEFITCERMGRICIAGDQDPELISQVIGRWQNWTGKEASKTDWRL